MEAMEYWKLCDSFTVVQAALLIVGENPAISQGYVLTNQPMDRPDGFDAAFAALTNAINQGKLRATIRRDARVSGWDEFPAPGEGVGTDEQGETIYYKPYPDWNLTMVTREDLTEWLFNRNFKPPSFFEQQTTNNSPNSLPGYLDKNHAHYSPKLAAAVRSWEAVTADPKYNNNGKTAKTNLTNWLTSHAGEFGLVKEDGEINADAIKNQIAKVANWQPDGGAPKTPSR
ncbi:MAG: hypothetical protein GX625_00050 [Clostridiaceae bacterium]|nr:hypothetical protein [Clostridiaceae bacterium]